MVARHAIEAINLKYTLKKLFRFFLDKFAGKMRENSNKKKKKKDATQMKSNSNNSDSSCDIIDYMDRFNGRTAKSIVSCFAAVAADDVLLVFFIHSFIFFGTMPHFFRNLLLVFFLFISSTFSSSPISAVTFNNHNNKINDRQN